MRRRHPPAASAPAPALADDDNTIDGDSPEPLSVRRSEGLTDGIYAVAMTLLVIDLKLPEAAAMHAGDAVANGLLAILPKAIAWIMSFFVLALFWLGHHRVFNHVRHVDSTLLTWNLVQLACVSLMPFCSSLIGEAASSLLAQVVYSTDMALLGLTALVISRHVYLHPALTRSPVPASTYHGARIRVMGVIVISIVAIGLAATLRSSGAGNLAFALMLLIVPFSHAVERREQAKADTAKRVAPRPRRAG